MYLRYLFLWNETTLGLFYDGAKGLISCYLCLKLLHSFGSLVMWIWTFFPDIIFLPEHMLLLFLIVASALSYLTVLISLLFTEKSVMHLYDRMILIRMYLEKLKGLYIKLMLFNKFSFQFVHVRTFGLSIIYT